MKLEVLDLSRSTDLSRIFIQTNFTRKCWDEGATKLIEILDIHQILNHINQNVSRPREIVLNLDEEDDVDDHDADLEEYLYVSIDATLSRNLYNNKIDEIIGKKDEL